MRWVTSPSGRLILAGSAGSMAILLVVAVLSGLVPAAVAVALRLMVDALTAGPAPGELLPAGPAPGELLPAAALFVAAGLVGILGSDLTSYLIAERGRTAAVQASSRLYERISAEPGLERLEDPAYQDRVALAGDATDTAPAQLLGALAGGVRSVAAGIGLFAVMVTTYPLVAAVAVAGAIPVGLVEARLTRRRIRLRTELMPVHRRRFVYRNLIVDPVAAQEQRLFGLRGFLTGRMVSDLAGALRIERRVDRVTLAAQSGLAAAQLALTVVVIGLVVRGAATPALTGGDVTALVLSFGSLTMALAGLIAQSEQFREARGLLAEYDAVVGDPPLRGTGTADVPPLRTELRLDDVWFRYGDDLPWVLRGVNLTVRAGESLALVGLNGAGKSTLVKLICGLYAPAKGRISWDGLDLGQADPAALRNRIAAMLQDFVRYESTAAENVGVGAIERITDGPAVRQAAREAMVDAELDRLPRGYETLLSRVLYRDPFAPDDEEPAVVLSGGQWQRVALARMLMRRDRDLLILDEPSSGLDPEAEYRLLQALGDTLSGRTRLLISHRLSAVRACDRIVVLADGRVIEEGTHQALVSTGGRYGRLFGLQAAGYQPEGNSR